MIFSFAFCRPVLKCLTLRCWWRTSELVPRQVAEETTLEELQLISCRALMDATVEKVLSGCNLRRLAPKIFNAYL
jgi:hypothetical protein